MQGEQLGVPAWYELASGTHFAWCLGGCGASRVPCGFEEDLPATEQSLFGRQLVIGVLLTIESDAGVLGCHTATSQQLPVLDDGSVDW